MDAGTLHNEIVEAGASTSRRDLQMNDDIIIISEEIRIVVIAGEERVIAVPAEHRVIEVPDDAFGQ